MQILMIAGLVVLLLVIVGIVFLTASGAMKYDRLLGEKNMSELSEILVKLKTFAIEHPLEATHDPAVQLDHGYYLDTDQGMRIIYTISKHKSTYQHHISLSGGPSYLAHSAALTFASWMGHCLMVDAAKISVPQNYGNQDGFVRHILFELDDGEQQEFANRQVRSYSPVEITKETWQGLMSEREKIIKNSLPPASQN